MQISLQWVDELISIQEIELNSLIEKLTISGFEVEETLEITVNKEKTFVLEISTTANRSDSLSLQGISTEIASLFNKPMKNLSYPTNKFNWQPKIENYSNLLADSTTCSIFISMMVKNLIDITSPNWLKQKLISSGVKPENTLLDFQNYVLLETGYPLELYDLEKIHSETKGKDLKLTLTNNETRTNFILKEIEESAPYQLTKSNIVLKANNFPISIAGLTVDKRVSCSTETSSLLIEGSIFSAAKIRQQSRSIGVRTDRGTRYEKSIKDSGLYAACYRLISLLRIKNPDLKCQLHTVSKPKKVTLHPILLNYKTVTATLGPVTTGLNTKQIDSRSFISVQAITGYLERLNFKQNYLKVTEEWEVQIPHLRSDDIRREIDLIEEIGRLHGFDHFLAQLPNLKATGVEDFSYQTRKKLTSCFTNMGLTELIHYSLVPPKNYGLNKIKLANPLLSDCSTLRSSLLPRLIQSVQENLNQQNAIIESFEYGHLFLGNTLKSLKEKEFISGIFDGSQRKRKWSVSPVPMNWFEAKGKIEQLFEKLNLFVYYRPFNATKYNQMLHPFCTSDLFLKDNSYVGVFGKINPILAKRLNLSLHMYLFEFDFESIQNQIQINKLVTYREYSTYPKIVKDLSFIISNKISFQNLRDFLFLNGSQHLIRIQLLDEYKGDFVPENHTSLCLQLIFQSDQSTLRSEQVEIILNHLQTLLTNKFEVKIRI